MKALSFQTKGNVALRCSSEHLGYYLSLTGQTEDGYYRNSATRYNQYSFRSNIDGKVSNNLNVHYVQTGGYRARNLPARSACSIFRPLMRGKPNLPAYWPNGLPGPDIEYGDNPVVIATPATGYDKDKRYFLQGNLGADFKVPGVSGLTLRVNAAYDTRFRNQKSWRTPWTLYDWDRVTRDANGVPVLQAATRGFSQPELNDFDLRSTDVLVNVVAEHRRNFGPHTLGILGGSERQKSDSSFVSAFRKHFISDQIDQIVEGGAADRTNGGNALVAR